MTNKFLPSPSTITMIKAISKKTNAIMKNLHFWETREVSIWSLSSTVFSCMLTNQDFLTNGGYLEIFCNKMEIMLRRVILPDLPDIENAKFSSSC